MALVYEQYLLTLSRGEAFAVLRRHALRSGLDIEEESGSLLFSVERCSLLAQVLCRGQRRLVVKVEESEGETAVCFYVWGHALGDAHETIRATLNASGLESVCVSDSEAKPVAGPVPAAARTGAGAKPPAWIRWAKAAEHVWMILALLVLGLGIWLGLPYAFVFLAVWAAAFFGPIVVTDLTVRQRLGIRSRRGTYAPLAVALVMEAAGIAGGWMLAAN